MSTNTIKKFSNSVEWTDEQGNFFYTVRYADKTVRHYKNGKLHNDFGPAVSGKDGVEYYRDGERYDPFSEKPQECGYNGESVCGMIRP